VNCPVCQQETSPVKIGGAIYCSVCGTPNGSIASNSKRLSLDLSPRRKAAPVLSGKPRPAKISSATPAVGAGALHQRVKPARVLDLRHGQPQPAAAQAVISNVHQDPAAPPKTTARERHLAHYSDRLEKARQIDRSPHINKFHQ
jgi:hypothetical protein